MQPPPPPPKPPWVCQNFWQACPPWPPSTSGLPPWLTGAPSFQPPPPPVNTHNTPSIWCGVMRCVGNQSVWQRKRQRGWLNPSVHTHRLWVSGKGLGLSQCVLITQCKSLEQQIIKRQCQWWYLIHSIIHVLYILKRKIKSPKPTSDQPSEGAVQFTISTVSASCCLSHSLIQ